MELKRIERIVENKYSLLLVSLVLLMIIEPIMDGYPRISAFFGSVLLVAIIAIALRISDPGKTFFSIAVSFAILAVVFHYLAVHVFLSREMGLAALFTYLLYTGMAIVFMLRKIFSAKLVNADTVKGGISIYILIGLWWQFLYVAIWLHDPNSLGLQVNSIHSPDFFYFSFSTMTTLGYGDVVAKSHAAKTAAVIEAITGQMYMAILISRLVSLHIAHSMGKK